MTRRPHVAAICAASAFAFTLGVGSTLVVVGLTDSEPAQEPAQEKQPELVFPEDRTPW